MGPSYTVDTLRELRERWPGADLVLLLGADAVRDLPEWHAPEEIVQLAQLAMLIRGGDTVPDMRFAAVPVPVTRVDVSATEIRRRVRDRVPIRYLVTEGVRDVIRREHLYLMP